LSTGFQTRLLPEASGARDFLPGQIKRRRQ
jgi:hypothetical protein